MSDSSGWPTLPYEEWAPTKKTLQMVTQMIGKARLSLSPPQPEWLHACLYLDARGFTTRAMPSGDRIVEMGVDVFDGTLRVSTSDGGAAVIPLGEGACVADIWKALGDATGSLGVDLDLWQRPQEIPDVTLFSENRHDCTFVSDHAVRYHTLLATIHGVFEEFRSPFFGRSSIQFWWGAFDLAVLLFNGKHAVAPDDRGYIMRYDLDAEHFNAGFWPGDDSSPAAGFYAYIVPRPDGCEVARIEPEHAGWVEAMEEWMLPYESVRTCPDPRQALLDFLNSTYQVALTNAGWDGDALSYTQPPSPPRT